MVIFEADNLKYAAFDFACFLTKFIIAKNIIKSERNFTDL